MRWWLCYSCPCLIAHIGGWSYVGLKYWMWFQNNLSNGAEQYCPCIIELFTSSTTSISLRNFVLATFLNVQFRFFSDMPRVWSTAQSSQFEFTSGSSSRAHFELQRLKKKKRKREVKAMCRQEKLKGSGIRTSATLPWTGRQETKLVHCSSKLWSIRSSSTAN